ncbi:MAG: helix-turn-helix transcriptional regulator [Acutalibacter sp.]|nr:helix-turn-helix transcriptional regulator [Acutalibacter sp.]
MKTKYEQEYIKFGLKVQYYRKLRGMTQETFAEKVGISWSYLAKVESPTRAFGVSMETLFSMAEVLDVPVSKLFES